MSPKKNRPKQYPEIPIKSWKDFEEIVSSSQYSDWAFRGQEDQTWPLNSSLARYLSDFKVHKDVWAHQEDRILRIFRRKAHLFLEHIPAEDNVYEWLALMQHHGAPTRLLDFTWSPFVAAFFALEKARTNAAVWAINIKEIKTANRTITRQYPLFKEPNQNRDEPVVLAPRTQEIYYRFYIENTIRDRVPFVSTGEPFNMSQRIIAQSGTFVVPGVLHLSVDEILSTYPAPETIMAKFVLDLDRIREDAMKSLYLMNITNATLFPGLDGMARSLSYELEFHWDFNPKTAEHYEKYLANLG